MIGFEQHDHGDCIATSLATAEARCKGKGLRLTDVRRRVLEILLERHQAMGAYDILEVLNADGLGSQPPVAYRALEFLVDHGFAHKVRRLNAFAACMHPGQPHSPAFFICKACDAVAEAPVAKVHEALGEAADALGFALERASLEVVGLCPTCTP